MAFSRAFISYQWVMNVSLNINVHPPFTGRKRKIKEKWTKHERKRILLGITFLLQLFLQFTNSGRNLLLPGLIKLSGTFNILRLRFVIRLNVLPMPHTAYGCLHLVNRLCKIHQSFGNPMISFPPIIWVSSFSFLIIY